MSNATVAEFKATFDGAAPPSARDTEIQACLDDACDAIAAAIGWDFVRHPTSGSEVRTFDGDGTRILHVHRGIVSVTLVEVAPTPGAWVALAATDWALTPTNPEPGEPYDHVELLPGASVACFPEGIATVRLTGATGYAAVPGRARRAEIALARQLYRADATTPGGIVGPDELAAGILPRGWPEATYRCIDHYRHKFLGCRI